jgi:hypothetical protein
MTLILLFSILLGVALIFVTFRKTTNQNFRIVAILGAILLQFWWMILLTLLFYKSSIGQDT